MLPDTPNSSTGPGTIIARPQAFWSGFAKVELTLGFKVEIIPFDARPLAPGELCRWGAVDAHLLHLTRTMKDLWLVTSDEALRTRASDATQGRIFDHARV